MAHNDKEENRAYGALPTHLLGEQVLFPIPRSMLAQPKGGETLSDSLLHDIFEIVLRVSTELPRMGVVRVHPGWCFREGSERESC